MDCSVDLVRRQRRRRDTGQGEPVNRLQECIIEVPNTEVRTALMVSSTAIFNSVRLALLTLTSESSPVAVTVTEGWGVTADVEEPSSDSSAVDGSSSFLACFLFDMM